MCHAMVHNVVKYRPSALHLPNGFMVAWRLKIQGVALVHIDWWCSMAAQQT